jgi:hypothetical protein
MDVSLLGYAFIRRSDAAGHASSSSEVLRNLNDDPRIVVDFALVYVRCRMRPFGLVYIIANTISSSPPDFEAIAARPA